MRERERERERERGREMREGTFPTHNGFGGAVTLMECDGQVFSFFSSFLSFFLSFFVLHLRHGEVICLGKQIRVRGSSEGNATTCEEF